MSEPVVFLPLTKGYVAVIDFADFEKVRGFKYQAHIKKTGAIYAERSLPLKAGRRPVSSLHRDLLNPGADQEIDHKDGDGLNNRRENLRIATRLQNLRGFKRKRKGTSSQFRGVSWRSREKKWYAQIQVEGAKKHLGSFDSEETAARAYDAATRKYFGDFATPNL